MPKASPEKKKQSGKQAGGNSSAPARKPAGEQPRKLSEPEAMIHQIIPVVLGMLGVLIGLCLIWKDGFGIFGHAVRWVLFGGFSLGAILVPFLFLSTAIFWKRSIEERNTVLRVVNALICLIALSVLLYVAQDKNPTFAPLAYGKDGLAYTGGGMIGGMVGFGLSKLFGGAGAVIISLTVLCVFGIFLVGLTPYGVWIRIQYYWREWQETRRIEKEMERQVAKESAQPKPKPKPAPEKETPAQVRFTFLTLI